MSEDEELCLVIAALTAQGLSTRKFRERIAQFLVFQSLERRIPIPDVVFDLTSFPQSLCVDRFRFTAPQIKTLLRELRMPNAIISAQGVPVPSTEALCLVLRRLSYPCRYRDLVFEFGRQPSVLCSIFNKMLLLIYSRVGKKMEFDEQIFTSYARASADSVFAKVGFVKNCIAFIDGTMRRICRPVEHQREVYSGFKKVHCVKYQGIMLANGLLVALHGPIEGRRHDSFMLADSKIEAKILELFPGCYLYGDAGYGLKEWLLRPFQSAQLPRNETLFNKALSSARVSVEWFFGEVVQYWAYVDYRKGMKIGKSPVGAMYIVATFLTNALMCARSQSKTSKYFGCPIPTLEEYLSNVDCEADQVEMEESCDDHGDDDEEDDCDDRKKEDDCNDGGGVGYESVDGVDGADGTAGTQGVDTTTGNTDGVDGNANKVQKLPQDQLKIVHDALYEGPLNEVLVLANGVAITRRHLQCLLPSRWLNDEIMNTWFYLLHVRNSELHDMGVLSEPSFFCNTFFYTMLYNGTYNYSNVARWMHQIDIFEMDKVFVPIHVANTHWSLAVIHIGLKRLQFYDSLSGSGRRCLEVLMRYLHDEAKAKHLQDFDDADWQLIPTEPDSPRQDNGSDCGVFTCLFAEHLARNASLSFAQRDIAFHRHRIALYILRGALPLEVLL